MNYNLKIHFLNDVTIWRSHIPALINMVNIKSPFLHQCKFHSNGNGFKIVQKVIHLIFIKSSRSKSPWLLMSTISPWFDKANLYLLPSIFFYLSLQNATICWISLIWWSDSLTWNLWTWKTFIVAMHISSQAHTYTHAPPLNNMDSISDLILIPILMLLCF